MKKLFVVWQDPETRMWYPVGLLSLEREGYRYVYTHGATLSNRFTPFGRMDDLHKAYESENLFPLFTNRLLSKDRPEYKDYLSWLNLDSENFGPFEEFERTAGIRATDSIVLVPFPEPQSDGTYGLRFFSNGIRYLPQEAQNWVEKLETGERLFLMLDNQNEKDPFAIAMRTEPVMVVGYVPRYYTQDIRQLLDTKASDSLIVCVEKVNKNAPSQFKLLCTLNAKWPDNFQPCSGDLFTPLA